METHRVTGVTFAGEQDGQAERELKEKISEVLGQFPSVQRAYLARVRYVGSSPDDVWVALCLSGTSESAEIAAACLRPFAAIFNHTQSLDVLFVNAEQEGQLARVCHAFYSR